MLKTWKIWLFILALIGALSGCMERSAAVATTARSTDYEVRAGAMRRVQFARRLDAVFVLLPQSEYAQLQRDWQLPVLAAQP